MNTEASSGAPLPGGRIRPALRALYHLLGSMRFAVGILLVVAVAACLGSVVPQNAGLATYVSSYGEFWTSILVFLGVTDVYHAVWFGMLLVVMATSTGVCVVRNTPAMIRQIRDPQDRVNRRFVEGLPCHAHARYASGGAALLATLAPVLQRQRYRVATRETADGALLVAARRGGARRVGYILTHAAVVMVTVAAFLDSDLALRVRVLFGMQAVETRDLPVDAVPAAGILPAGTLSYRGQVTLAEGESASNAIVPIGEGYLIQPLPFRVRLHRFHIERYPNGQPRDFISELEVQAPGQPPTRHALRVNHPLTAQGVTLYQSGFTDGGSRLRLTMLSRAGTPIPLEATVGIDAPLLVDHAPWTFHATDLRLDNVQGAETSAEPPGALDRFLGGRRDAMTDLGPSIEYELRDPAGQALTMVTYLRPLAFGGNRYMVSGIRRADAGKFDYIRIPVDADGSTATFERFERSLRDPEARVVAARAALVAPSPERVSVASRALGVFANQGFAGISAWVATTVPPAEHDAMATLLSSLVARAAQSLASGGGEQGGAARADLRLTRDLLGAHDDLISSDAPVWAIAGSYDKRNASGLQVARRGGDALLITGLLMLAIGVSLLYLVRERRFWLWWDPTGQEVVAGLRANRRIPGLETELAALLAPFLPPDAGGHDSSDTSESP